MKHIKKFSSMQIPDLYKILLTAADVAGGPGGLVDYFQKQALENPHLFIHLFTKLTDMNRSWRNDEAVQITKIEISAPQLPDGKS